MAPIGEMPNEIHTCIVAEPQDKKQGGLSAVFARKEKKLWQNIEKVLYVTKQTDLVGRFVVSIYSSLFALMPAIHRSNTLLSAASGSHI